MKKSLLALALIGAFSGAASAQSSVTIYGLIDAGISHDSNANPVGATTALNSGLQSGSRLGFKGTEVIDGTLKANFVLEQGISVDTGASSDATKTFERQAFVGLSGDFGAINLGRQKSLLYTAQEVLDPFGAGLAGDMHRFFGTKTKTDNAVTVNSANFDGLVLSGQVGLGEVAGHIAYGRTFSVQAKYATGPLAANFTFEKKQSSTTGLDVFGGKRLLGGVTYDFKAAKAFVAYESVRGGNNTEGTADSKILAVGATIPFTTQDNLIVGYTTKRDDFVATDNKSSQIAFAVTHALSARTNLYFSAARTANDAKVSVNTVAKGGVDRLTTFGIRHQF